MPDYRIEFVFRRVSPPLRLALVQFWEQHRADWTVCTRPPQRRHQFTVDESHEARSLAILSNVACVAYTNTNQIAAVAWLKIAPMPVDSETPELIYFQRMYVSPEHRCVLLTHRMIKAFHCGLINSALRSPQVKYLLAENANAKLKTPIGRRFFVRLGFIFVGINNLGNEIWKMPLPMPSLRPVRSVFAPRLL